MPQTDFYSFSFFILSLLSVFLMFFFILYIGLNRFFLSKFNLYLSYILKVFSISSKNLFTFKSTLFQLLCFKVDFFFDPLAQFSLETYNFDWTNVFYLNLHFRSLIFFVCVTGLCYFLTFFLYNFFVYFSFVKLLPQSFFVQIDSLSNLVNGLVKENLSIFAARYAIILEMIFYSIFLFNFIGLIPFSFTITSQISFTLFMSLAVFTGINILGLRVKGLCILSLFLPSGVPLFISPFLVVIEIISYFARIFSLGIRLFANMMAGHALTVILSGYAWAFFLINAYAAGFSAFGVVFCIIWLESLVAFLQAYVFTMLVGIYINDVLAGH